MISPAHETLRRFLQRVKGRYLRIRGREVFLDAAFLLTSACAVLFLTLKILQILFGLQTPWLTAGTIGLTFASAIGVSLLAGLAVALLSRPPLERVVLEIDRRQRMDGRLITAYELLLRGKSGAMPGLLLQDAAHTIEPLTATRALPLPPVGYRWGTALALGTALLLAFFPAPAAIPAPSETPGPKAVSNNPSAEFTAEPTRGNAPLTVTFRNTSRHAKRFNWDFGDGKNSTDIHPVHTYSTSGTYTAVLHASSEKTGGRSSFTQTIHVRPAGMPVAGFTALPTQGKPPLKVHFEDRSKGKDLSYLWDFGDPFTAPGRNNELPNPVHTYKHPGTYTVKLIVHNAAGEDELVREQYIRVGDEGGGGTGANAISRVEPMPRTGPAPKPPAISDREGKLYGEKTERPKINPIPEGVKPIEQDGPRVEKERPVYTPKEGQPGTPESTPYHQAFQQYRKMAEDAIHRETIPPEAREFIKKYFEAIRPK